MEATTRTDKPGDRPTRPGKAVRREIRFRDRITATVDETCEAAGFRRTKCYELLKKGQITSTTVGRRRLIIVKSVLALLEGAEAA